MYTQLVLYEVFLSLIHYPMCYEAPDEFEIDTFLSFELTRDLNFLFYFLIIHIKICSFSYILILILFIAIFEISYAKGTHGISQRKQSHLISF